MNGSIRVQDTIDVLRTQEVDRLKLEAELSMPKWDDPGQDWTKFNTIVAELKRREGVNIVVVAGDNTEGISRDDIDCIVSNWSASYGGIYGYKEGGFLHHVIDNINQHILSGVGLVIRQEIITAKGNKYTEISVIDNGEGPISKQDERLSVKYILKNYGRSLGKYGGHAGISFSLAIRHYADLSVVYIHGSATIVKGGELWDSLNSDPHIIEEIPHPTKTHGMTVVGYFYEEGTDSKDVKQDVIKRAKEHIRLFAEKISSYEKRQTQPAASYRTLQVDL